MQNTSELMQELLPPPSLHLCPQHSPPPIVTYWASCMLYFFCFQPISQLLNKVKIVEVGPRDGLQNEAVCETLYT